MHLPLLRKITSTRVLRVLVYVTMFYLILGIAVIIAAVPVAIWYDGPTRIPILVGMVVGGLFVWMTASLVARDLTQLAAERASRQAV